jgi:hypothetical protein
MRHPNKSAVLNAADISMIEQGSYTLPGNWYLDPVVDLTRSRKPRVWIRWANKPLLKIGFERIGTIIWITGLDRHRNARGIAAGWPFARIAAAFTFLWGMLDAIEACRRLGAK